MNVIDETFTEEIAQLLVAIPSADSLAQLASIDPRTLTPSLRLDYLSALERQASWVQALIQRAIIAVAGHDATESDDLIYDIDEAEREDISTILRISPTSAQIKIDTARTLTKHLPNTCSALATGEISAAHATAIARETTSAIDKGLPESVIFEIENRALTFSEFHTPLQVGNLVRNLVAKNSPAEFEESVLDARETRKVAHFPDIDGMATVLAILPAEGAQIVMNAIEAKIYEDTQRLIEQQRLLRQQIEDGGMDNSDGNSYFDSATGTGLVSSDAAAFVDGGDGLHDPRDKDQKRADALIAIAELYLAQSSDVVTPHRRPLTVNVTVDLPTLMGLAENPGELAGYGAIPASIAREIASDARWKRFITDPITGNLLDFGREMYEPPQALKDFLIARDKVCRFPGCRRSALLSDLDHAQPFDDGGETSPTNIGALCRRHHKLKTHGGWKVESNPDGSAMWRSPFGKTFFTPARSQYEPI